MMKLLYEALESQEQTLWPVQIGFRLKHLHPYRRLIRY